MWCPTFVIDDDGVCVCVCHLSNVSSHQWLIKFILWIRGRVVKV